MSLKILMVSAEVAPFAKVGGLADVVGALPAALAARGHDVRVVMPCYPLVENDPRYMLSPLFPHIPVQTRSGHGHGSVDEASVFTTPLNPSVPLYLIRHREFFSGAVSSRTIYPQPVESTLFFSQAVFALLRALRQEWTPDIIHCHDWHTGLIPVLLREQWRPAGELRDTATLFTIHNLEYQGLFDRSVLDAVGLSQELFTPHALEFYGKASFMKAGLLYADLVNTVSPTYAREIQAPEYGCGLDGVLRELASHGRLCGILNGIDVEEYNPETDSRIAAHFSARNFALRERNRAALRKEFGLDDSPDAPLLGMVTRLFAPKGLRLIAAVMDRLIDMGFQFVVLGQGEPIYEALFKNAQARSPRRVAARIGFEADLGPRIFAGCDAFLMPSLREPCGLGQLMAMRYGALPIVRKTGGLADTVIDDDGSRPNATGFVFEGTAPETLLECMKRVKSTFLNRPRWNHLATTALAANFSWPRSAAQYIAAYHAALAARRTGE